MKRITDTEAKEILSEGITAHRLTMDDIPFLVPIIETWVRDSQTGEIIESEVSTIKNQMRISTLDNRFHYFALLDEMNRPIGMAGFRQPEERLIPYIGEIYENPTIELINVFMDPNFRGKGLGKNFMDYLMKQARNLGFSRVVWSSGRRYEKTAWAFYNKYAGDPIKGVDNFFGEDTFAYIWQVVIQ